MSHALRIVVFVFALVLSACRALGTETDSAPISGAFVPARDVDALEQPESQRVVGRLRAGNTYPLAKRGGPGKNWCKVHVGSADGWVLCSEATAAAPAPAPAPAPPPTGAPGSSTVPTITNAGNGFAYWVLTLSWSPTFCETPAGVKSPEQCGTERHYGFVVHGLWPQNERGWPESCAGELRLLPKELVSRNLDIMPSRQLIEHEWEKHGTCSGLTADEYFARVRAAFGSISIPDAYVQPKAPFTTSLDQILNAFTSANPRLDKSAIAVACKRDLDEVRICLDKQLTPRACASDVRSACKGSVNVPPLR